MIDRIVVPLDGSPTAEAVLPQVRRLLFRKDAEVVLVRAENPVMVESPVPVTEAALSAAREYLAGVQERLVRDGARARSVVRLGSSAGTILEVADEVKAGLIAMSTHGRSGVGRFLFGSVAEVVVRKSRVPVLTLRPQPDTGVVPTALRPVRNILVPFDGSELSKAILPAAEEMARLFEARVVLLRVLDPRSADVERARTGPDLEQVAEKFVDRENAVQFLREVENDLQGKGIPVLTLLEEGHPVKQILEVGRFHEVDLIAMTTHGRSGLSRMIAGSVTEEVLRRSTVPLMILRGEPVPAAAPLKEAR